VKNKYQASSSNYRYHQNKIIKLHLLSLLSFFAIAATSVNGHSLRGDTDHRTLVLDENEITTMGKMSRKEVHSLSGLFVEQLSLKAAPVDLTKAQNHVEMLTGDLEPRQSDPTEDYVYNQCADGVLSGNGYLDRSTTKIYGEVTPITGCVAFKSEKFEGGVWITSGEVVRPCVGQTGVVLWWGEFGTYSVDVFEAYDDSYLLKVCWD
jgi:hypothetical protein